MADTIDSITQSAGNILNVIDMIIVIIFTLEYVLRVWCCVERKKYGRRGPFWGNLTSSH